MINKLVYAGNGITNKQDISDTMNKHFCDIGVRLQSELRYYINQFLEYLPHRINHFISLNILRPRQNGRRFADETFKRIFLNENVRISIKILLKFVPKGPINDIPALVLIMAWRRPGDKSLSEPMMVSLPTHICVTRSQWVNTDLNRWRTFLNQENDAHDSTWSWLDWSQNNSSLPRNICWELI